MKRPQTKSAASSFDSVSFAENRPAQGLCVGDHRPAERFELRPIPEAPVHQNAGQTAVLCGLGVYLGIAHIDGPRPVRAQQREGQVHHIRRGLAAAARTLADGQGAASCKESPVQGLNREIRLVGDDADLDAGFCKRIQRGLRLGIESGRVQRVGGIVGAERAVDGHGRLLHRAGRDRPAHGHPQTIAQKTRDEEQRLERAGLRLENSRKARADTLLNFELVTREEILKEFRRRSEVKVQELTRVIQGLEEERDRLLREIEAGSGQAESPETESPEAGSSQAESPETESPGAGSGQAENPETESPEAGSGQAESPEAESQEAGSLQIENAETDSPEQMTDGSEQSS